MVIFGHLLVHSNFSFLVESFPILRRLGRFGVLGVLIFFFISGFVICRGLIKERAKTSGTSLKAFYVRRSFRILPPLWLFLLILLVLASCGVIDITHAQIENAALFLCNMSFLGGCTWYAGHTWSLAYEEQFYLAFPVLFLAFDLMRRRRLALVFVFACMVLSIERRFFGHTLTANYLMNICFLLSGCVAALYEPEVRRIAIRVTFVHWSIAAGGARCLRRLAAAPIGTLRASRPLPAVDRHPGPGDSFVPPTHSVVFPPSIARASWENFLHGLSLAAARNRPMGRVASSLVAGICCCCLVVRSLFLALVRATSDRHRRSLVRCHSGQAANHFQLSRGLMESV